MDDEGKGHSEFEKADARNASLLREIAGFLGENKKWWLVPILVTFLVIGVVALLSTTPAMPFIYTLF